MSNKGKYSLLVCLAFLLMVTAVTIAGGKWKKHTVLKSDAAGYYAYLPALFIYDDLYTCGFYPDVDSVYNPGDGVVYYGVQRHAETGRVYFKYNYGVAAFEMPLFLTAHCITKLSGKYATDGYSAPYQLAIALSTVLFSFFGLLLLRLLLLRFFNDLTVAIVLFITGFGTNYLAQVITQPGISHVYMIFLYAAILYSVHRFTETARGWFLLVVAAALAMVLVTRSSGVFIVIPVLFWQVGENLFARVVWQYMRTRPVLFTGIALLGFLPVFVQMLYWQLTTGHWYFYTYRREYFDFANSQIVNGLFSYRKGWLLYTPLALLGFAGLLPMWRNERLRFAVVPVTAYFIITVYVVFSWWQWYYGGSFGCRVMVESLVVLAVPLGAFVNWAQQQRLVVKMLLGGMIVAGVFLNLFQTVQYGKGIIHWQKMNKEYYWRVFGRLQVSEEDKKLLMQTEELDTDNSPLR
jgi:hypothetical protein